MAIFEDDMSNVKLFYLVQLKTGFYIAPFFAYKYLSYKQKNAPCIRLRFYPAFKGAGYQFRSDFDHIFKKYTKSMDLTQSLPNFFDENAM
jgi:hypothetical protein